MFQNEKPITLLKLYKDLENNNFSISFDKWTNCDHAIFITVTIYFVQKTKCQFQFESHVLFTVDQNKSIDWDYYFTDFNMNKCSVALLNFQLENEPLAYFLEVNSNAAEISI